MKFLQNKDKKKNAINFINENGEIVYYIEDKKEKFEIRTTFDYLKYYCVLDKKVATIYDENNTMYALINKKELQNNKNSPISITGMDKASFCQAIYNKEIQVIKTSYGDAHIFFNPSKQELLIYINNLLMLRYNGATKETEVMNNFPSVEFALILVFVFNLI